VNEALVDAQVNDEQITAVVKETFDSVAAGYDGRVLRFFFESAKRLSACLDLCGDERVLDVATGTGHAALAIARRLPGGRVTGVDFSRGMLDEARDKAAAMGLDNVEFHERDMRALGFAAGSFDAAVCAFGIFFVNDMDTQLSHIASMVKPGGRVAITSFQEDYFHPLRDLMHERLAGYGTTQSPEAWKRVATKAGCRNLFERANLQDVEVETKNVGYYLDTAEDWWDVIWNAGFRRLVSQLPSDGLRRFKKEHLEEVKALQTASGIWLNAPVLFTTGITPPIEGMS
jgi:ubiquinone/menaquinone biosynthesis C-methylase UbiE